MQLARALSFGHERYSRMIRFHSVQLGCPHKHFIDCVCVSHYIHQTRYRYTMHETRSSTFPYLPFPCTYVHTRPQPPPCGHHNTRSLFHPSVTASDTTTIYACGILGHSIVMPLAGLLQFTLGLRGCAACGCLLVSLATLLSSLATSVAALAFLNSVFGVGIAFA